MNKATDISVRIHFPENITSIDDLKEYREILPPIPPKEPQVSLYSLGWTDSVSHFFKEASFHRPILYSYSAAALEKIDNHYVFNEHIISLRHKKQHELKSFYLICPQDLKGFAVQYEIISEELLDSVTGKINFKIVNE